MVEKLTREDVERIVSEAKERRERAPLSGANLSGVNLNGADLRRANLFEADLYKADLSRANLNWADLRETTLREATLREATLRTADLREADLHKVILSRATLRTADLSEVNLSGANLSGAILSGANLSGANLSGAILEGADLSEVNLSGVDLRRANLREANLNLASFGYTSLSNLDLRQVKGLYAVLHLSPSHIDTHTLQRSQDQIPEIFLRGCGLSDWEIENVKLYNPNLTPDEFTLITYEVHRLRFGNPIYFSCFISYSSKDQAFAERIHTDLQNNGVRCWYAPEDMKIGDKIRHSIDQAIRLQDKLLLILSGRSVNSQWVESEVERAFALERRRKETVLFPIRVDNAVMKTDVAWASEIKDTRHIGDFCQWQDETAYQASFKRLLEDLRAEG